MKFQSELTFSFKSANMSEKLVILYPENKSLGPYLVTLTTSLGPNKVPPSMSPDPNPVFLSKSLDPNLVWDRNWIQWHTWRDKIWIRWLAYGDMIWTRWRPQSNQIWTQWLLLRVEYYELFRQVSWFEAESYLKLKFDLDISYLYAKLYIISKVFGPWLDPFKEPWVKRCFLIRGL